MSPYRASLPDAETRTAFDAATGTAARAYAAGAAAVHQVAAAEGPRAVAERAWFPGHPLTVPEIADRYVQLYGPAGARAA